MTAKTISGNATPGYGVRLQIFFAHDRHGRKVAYRFSWAAERAFRMSLADAEIFIANETADQIPGHPFKPAR